MVTSSMPTAASAAIPPAATITKVSDIPEDKILVVRDPATGRTTAYQTRCGVTVIPGVYVPLDQMIAAWKAAGGQHVARDPEPEVQPEPLRSTTPSWMNQDRYGGSRHRW